MRKTSPVNSTCVCKLSISEVPSKIYSQAARLNGASRGAYLHDGTLATNLEHLTLSHLTVAEAHIHDFGVSKIK